MTATGEPARPAGNGALVLFALFVVLCHLRIYWGVWDAIDIGLWDELSYLEYGVELGWRNATAYGGDALLYRAWYRVLSLFLADRIDVYMANWIIVPLAVAALIGLVVMRMTATRSVVVLCLPAFLFLISIRSFELWPRITMFLAAFVLVTLLAVRRARTPAAAFLVLAAMAFLASYIRSEMLVAVPVALVAAAVAARHLPGADRRRLAAAAAVAVTGGVLVVVLFVHPAFDNGIRQQIAMAQHLAIDWVRQTGADADGFSDAEEIIPAIFGAETRWWRWPLQEPAFVLNHLAYNLARLPAEAAAFLNHPPILLPGTSHVARMIEAAVVGAFVLGTFALVAVRDGRGFVRRHRLELAAIAILALPEIVASVMLYPHAHYLLAPCVLGLVVFGMALAWLGAGERWPRARVVFFVAVLLLLTPGAFRGYYMARYGSPDGTVPRPTIETIRQFRALGFNRPLRILTHDYGYAAYLRGVVIEVMMRQMGRRPFVAFLVDLRPDVIIVDAAMSRSWRLRDDLGWKNFIADPAAAGFRRIAVAGTDRQILVRSTLRCRHPACAD